MALIPIPRLILLLCVAAAALPPVVAQNPRFTVDDMLDVVNVSPAALSRDGRWLVIMQSTSRDRLGVDSHRYGDPTYIAPGAALAWIIDTDSGRRTQLYDEKHQLASFEWSPDGTRLLFLKRSGDAFTLVIWERTGATFTEAAIPADRVIDPLTAPRWSESGDRIYFALRSADWGRQARAAFEALTTDDIVVLSGEKPFLAWEELRRMPQLRTLAAYDVASAEVSVVVPETRLLGVRHSRDGRFHIVMEDQTEKTDYQTIGGTVSRIQVIPAAGGEARTIREDVKGSSRGPSMTWSRHNGHYAYAEKGKIFFAAISDEEPRQLTGDKEDDEEAGEKGADSGGGDADEDKEKPETFSPQSLSPDGRLLVASSRTGLWLIETADGARTRFIERDEEDEEAPTYRVLDWGPGALYLSYTSNTEWQRGFVRYDIESGELADLVVDDRLYRGFRLADDGRTVVFQAADGNRPYDVYAADAGFSNVRRLTEANPALDGSRLSRTELITYLDVDGKKTHGVLYYPLDYVEGQQYPTVFNVYESYFDNGYSGTIAVLNAHGYAVVRPSVNLERGYPGEAWVKGVTAAANKVIELGVADSERLGVHGTSYGGYATNLLIAQTNRFKAAINISGKVNMVSFYTDSPRLGTRNIHAPENSQDRIGATLWEQPQKYIAHSAVMFADRIKTPLLLVTGEQDHNVPARQAMEMYYALRRLGRTVEWVSYTNGGHGMPRTNAAEVHDYHRRILAWYEKYLKAPEEEKTEEGG